MNWDAIGAVGEIAGAVAVIATLIYFSMQIRGLQADSYAELLTRVEEGERDLHKLSIEHAELILKANKGGELSAEQAFVLEEIFLSNQSFRLFAYLRSQAYGRDGFVQIRNYARFLRRNPIFAEYFNQAEIRTSVNPGAREFSEQVALEMTKNCDA